MQKIIHIDECCTGCGECVEVCPNGVWALVGNKAQAIFPDDCMGCGNCVESCPISRPKFLKYKSGKIDFPKDKAKSLLI